MYYIFNSSISNGITYGSGAQEQLDWVVLAEGLL